MSYTKRKRTITTHLVHNNFALRKTKDNVYKSVRSTANSKNNNNLKETIIKEVKSNIFHQNSQKYLIFSFALM